MKIATASLTKSKKTKPLYYMILVKNN